MSKLTILCDLDGIVADLLGPWIDWYNQAYFDNLEIGDVHSWDLHECVRPECGVEVYDFINQDGTFADLKPLPGAVEGIESLRSAGHNVVIVTAGPDNPQGSAEKLAWCKQYLGMGKKDVIITHQKELVRGDVLIDDSPTNIKSYNAANPDSIILTIAYPYNRAARWRCERFDGWDDTRGAWSGIVDAVKWHSR